MPTSRELRNLFDALAFPEGGKPGLRFSAAEVPGVPSVRVGKGHSGAPALLIDVPGSGPAPQDVRLRNLSVLYGATCHISGSRGDREVRLSVVACEGDPDLHDYFFDVGSGLIAALGQAPTADSVARVLRAFIELFRAVLAGPRRSTQGVWGELLVIAAASDPTRMASAWHVEPNDRFDFAEGQVRLDVKTCGRSGRRHHFTLDQLTAPLLDVFIASLVVEPSAAGVTVGDLVDRIKGLLDEPALIATLEEKVGHALGSSWRDRAGAKFDEALALGSLKLYLAPDIPRVPDPIPTAVTRVSFEADLEGCPEVMPDARPAGSVLELMP